MSYGRSWASWYREAIKWYPILPTVEQRRLARNGQIDRIIESNLRFVLAIAKKRGGWYGLWIGDAVGIGNLAIVEAAARYRPECRATFTTYAKEWIEGAIKRAVLKRSEIVPHEIQPHIQSDGEGDADRDGLSPFEAAVSSKIDPEPETMQPHSITPDPERELQRVERMAEIRMAVQRLEWPERHVIDMRYGLDGGEGLTRLEVAERLFQIDGLVVTEDGVRQIEKRALKRLRKHGGWRMRKPKEPRPPARVPKELPCEHTRNDRHGDRWPWPFACPVLKYPFRYMEDELERTPDRPKPPAPPVIWIARYGHLIHLHLESGRPYMIPSGNLGGPSWPWRTTRVRKTHERIPKHRCGRHIQGIRAITERPARAKLKRIKVCSSAA
ncbi:MAG TPA: sigma-70 family RNA polymerase sigma factor [Candidatus Polarisedimenticolia bacterium]|jgi:RNA polymerase sigma factor (sigma-70 family)|nr:sigma-70 family RNA polymerase sigma factor [Candidatus Polarisedimenticolia bacterium]